MKRMVIAAAALAFVAVSVLVLGLVVWAGVRYLWPGLSSQTAAGRRPSLRAVMKDEDAPRPLVPSLALQVNEAREATVFAGTPVWFHVNVVNAAAMNDAAGTRVLGAKIERLKARPGTVPPAELQRLEEAQRRRTTRAPIRLGDDEKPWTAAVQLLSRDGKGGEAPLGMTLEPLGSEPGSVELDGTNAARSELGTTSAGIAPGTYSIVACLAATGSWRGRSCSGPVKLTVSAMPGALSPAEQLALDRQRARFALRTGDSVAVERYGRKLVEAHPASLPGHVYIGEALFVQGRWEEALQEFLTARAEFDRQQPHAVDRPQYLNARINQLLDRLE
jgi:hypothetical protein